MVQSLSLGSQPPRQEARFKRVNLHGTVPTTTLRRIVFPYNRGSRSVGAQAQAQGEQSAHGNGEMAW